MAKSLLWLGFVLRCCPKFMCLVFSLAIWGEEACKKKELRPSEGVLPEDVMEPLMELSVWGCILFRSHKFPLQRHVL